MPKIKKTIEIPLDLATLLAASPDDFKDPDKYDQIQVVSKALLKVLIETQR